MIKYIIPSLLLLLLGGCGSSDKEETSSSVAKTSNEKTDENTQKTSNEEIDIKVVKTPIIIEMQQNLSYSVYKGDELKKTSSNAKVTIVKDLQGSATTVVLIEGTAQITRAE